MKLDSSSVKRGLLWSTNSENQLIYEICEDIENIVVN